MIPISPQRIRVIDSHTGGEPTRVIIGGAAEPYGATMMEKRDCFAREFEWLRTASVCEPRGHDAVVGAMLCQPVADNCVTGVIFFNNIGCLNGCIHGTMGVAATLAHLGQIEEGIYRIDTPTGVVTAEIDARGSVKVRNVPSYRHRSRACVSVEGYGNVVGDVAWGGNWFFLTHPPQGIAVHADQIDELTRFSRAVRKKCRELGVTGADGSEIDHIEVFGPPEDPLLADSKNFVLCPGNAYDRSPCGTGTSAKLACLYADRKLKIGSCWRQAGILDTVFEGRIEACRETRKAVIPIVTGSAFVTAETELLIDPEAPFAFGIPSRLK